MIQTRYVDSGEGSEDSYSPAAPMQQRSLTLTDRLVYAALALLLIAGLLLIDGGMSR